MTVFKDFGGVYILSEIGINHGGSLEDAKKLIDASVEAGAQGVKIQVRDLNALYTEEILKDPLKAEQGTQYILKELERVNFSFTQVEELFKYAERYNIDFFASPFDENSADFLEKIGCPLFKIGSPDFTNLPLIKQVAGYGKTMILSTGMSTEEEIREVSSRLISIGADFHLLHCNSTYPASYEDLNLRYMPKLAQETPGRVGYSGHEPDFAPTLAAVALGATIIERHITFDPRSEGADQSSSLSTADFKLMVKSVRIIEKSLGISSRVKNQGEIMNLVTLGKSLVAKFDIQEGEKLTEEMFTSKSPAKGISPLNIDDFIGKIVKRDVKRDSFISYDILEEEKAVERFSISNTWGIVGRLNDFEDFLDLRPDLVELHLTWRDMDNWKELSLQDSYSQDLVVHAPEYYNDKLIDFTSTDSEVTEYSLEMLRRTIKMAQELSPRFAGAVNSEGPRVIVHPGGHFSNPTLTNKTEQYQLLKKNLESVDTSGVRVLVENMPPLPWYFGGQWHNTVFMESSEIAQFAKEMNWGVCYDLSHAQLYCNSAGKRLEDFTQNILPHIDYLHISDAKGVTQEGMQLGEGDLDMSHLLAIFAKLDVGFIPEIWNGHLHKGAGMKKALKTIEGMLNTKIAGQSCCAVRKEEACCGKRHK